MKAAKLGVRLARLQFEHMVWFQTRHSLIKSVEKAKNQLHKNTTKNQINKALIKSRKKETLT